MKTKNLKNNDSHTSGDVRACLLFPLLWFGLVGGVLLFLWPVELAAQNGVSISNLSVEDGTVSFKVSWSKENVPPVWSDTVWVWVDYNENGVMTRLPLSSGATLTATSAEGVGKVVEEAGNSQGVWVVGNAREAGVFSATVQLLAAIADVPGACAYASNYPPIGKYTATNEIAFTGTPQYTIVLKKDADNTTETRTSDTPFTVPDGYTVQSFTDKTGAPGIVNCMPSATYNLTVSATAYCAGSAVTFALSNTTPGQTYRLYRGADAMGVITGTGSPATFTGTLAGAGTYTAHAVAEKGYCAAVMAGVHTVSEIPLPAAPVLAASASTVCQNTNITFRVTSPVSGATYTWLGTAGTASGTGNGTYTVSGATAGAKPVTAYARLTTNGTTCQSNTSATVSATVNALPANPSVTAASRCGTGTVALRASSSGAVIDWYAASSGGSALLGGNNTYTTPSITASKAYYAQARNSTTGCLSASRTAATATVNAVPANPSVTAASRCGTGTVVLRASSSGAVIDWYAASSGGTALLSGNNTYTTPSITASKAYYAQGRNSTTGCLSASRTSVTATVNAVPANPSVTAASRCGTGTVALRASSSGAVIDWYAASSGGTALKSASNTYTTPSLSASKAYYAQGRNSTTSCLSASRTSVTATVTQYGASGAAPTSCGCASGLVACNGKCASTCPPQYSSSCTAFNNVIFHDVTQSECSQKCQTAAGTHTYYNYGWNSSTTYGLCTCRACD